MNLLQQQLDFVDLMDNQVGNIYYQRVLQQFIAALKQKFCCVCFLMGEEHFTNIASQYAKYYPSRSPSLKDYGEFFPSFLKRNDTHPDKEKFYKISLLENTTTAN